MFAKKPLISSEWNKLWLFQTRVKNSKIFQKIGSADSDNFYDIWMVTDAPLEHYKD